MFRALKVAEAIIDYVLPREVFGPVFLVFMAEGVVEELLTIYVPEPSMLEARVIILLAASIAVSFWGAVDEDIEELEEDIEEIMNEK